MKSQKITSSVIVWALAGAVAVGQYIAFGAWLDDSVVNAYAPSRTDAIGYVDRAKRLSNGESFADVFRDGGRMPGYSLVLAGLYGVTDRPLLAARFAQLCLTSVIVCLAFWALRFLGLGPRRALLSSVPFAVWPAFYAFTPILIAESASLFLVAGLVVVLAKATGGQLWTACVAAVLVGALTYLKPNHALLAIPCVCFFLAVGGARRRRWIHCIAFCIVLGGCLAPWSVHQSRLHHRFVGLSTNQGWNLYLGAGGPPPDSTSATVDSHLFPQTLSGDEVLRLRARAGELERLSPGRRDRAFQQEALRIWRARPLRTAALGLAKVCHTFGFSFRSMRDVAFGLFTVASLAGAWVLFRSRAFRSWLAFFVGVTVVCALQSFVFLADQRFRIVMFDFPAWLTIVLAVHSWLSDHGRNQARADLKRTGIE